MKTLENRLENRLVSLDVFRGFTVASMILVNNPGSWIHIFPQLKHATWHGCTFADLVFPFFLWIVGVAITLSFAHRTVQKNNPTDVFAHIFLRFLILFALGLFLSGFPFGITSLSNFSWATIRIPGTLQRIAICYLVTSLLVLYTKVFWQVLLAIILLVGTWILVKTIPVPGFGIGILEAKGSLFWYIDSLLLHNHTWVKAPAPGFDPEGVLSTLPAIATTLFGALTGQFLLTPKTPKEKTKWLLLAGGIFILLGLSLNSWIPINKNIWTPSFAIFSAGMAATVFAICYWLVDIKKYLKIFKPFQIYGTNALTAFVVSILILQISLAIIIIDSKGIAWSLKYYYYKSLFLSIINNEIYASLAHAIVFVLFMYLLSYLLYRSKLIIKA